MRIIIALSVLVSMILARSNQGHVLWKPLTFREIKFIRAECLARNRLPPYILGKLKSFEYINEPCVHQYLHCMATKMGFLCPEFGVHADRIARQLAPDLDANQVKNAAEDCSNAYRQSTNYEILAYEVFKCFVKSPVGVDVKNVIKNKYRSK